MTMAGKSRAIISGAATAFLLSQAALFEQLALAPARPASAATTFSDIQFDMGAFINPAQIFNDGAGSVTAQFAPVYALLQPVKLNRTPTKADQTMLANALTTIEASYPASPSGVLIFSVSYGVPYFNRLPQSVVQANMARGLHQQRLPGHQCRHARRPGQRRRVHAQQCDAQCHIHR